MTCAMTCAMTSAPEVHTPTACTSTAPTNSTPENSTPENSASEVRAMRARHEFPEAFCLLTYRCEEHRDETETIWNSRDGAVAYVITMTCGATGAHAHWNQKTYAPNYQPRVGERIFVDLSEDRARILATQVAAKWWVDSTSIGHEARRIYSSELELICGLYDDMAIDISDRGPDLVAASPLMMQEKGWSQG